MIINNEHKEYLDTHELVAIGLVDTGLTLDFHIFYDNDKVFNLTEKEKDDLTKIITKILKRVSKEQTWKKNK